MQQHKNALPASSAIVERNGRYLLVLRRNPPSAAMYAFPGGRGEAGETPAETAIRELFEETGIKARNPRLFETYLLPGRPQDGPASPTYLLSVFRVDADTMTEAVAADDAAAVGWFTAEEISRLPAPDSVRECIGRLEEDRATVSS